MIDVHPPHEAAHSWTDFFIHMVTICLGLLIAIGLEQSLEWVHHKRELRELHDSLQRDTEKQIEDARYYEAVSTFEIARQRVRMHQVGDALRTHRPVAQPLPSGDPPAVQTVAPIDPAWKAATASDLLVLVRQQDIVAYSEVDGIVGNIQEGIRQAHAAERTLAGFEREMALRGDPGEPPLSKATPEELKTYLADLDAVAITFGTLGGMCRVLRGADTAILAGERNLGKIEASEIRFSR